ncbi:MAG: WD40 repeat domain-containing protein [Chloroflexota bacterium]
MFTELDAAGQRWVQHLFLQLIAFSGQNKLTGRRLPDVEWLPAPPQLNTEAIVDQFVAFRLLARAFDVAKQRPVLSLAHESLMVSWPRLANWISGAQIDLEQRRGLRLLLAAWQGADNAPGYLLQGAQFETYHLWAQRSLLPLTPEEQSFLQASQQQEDRRRTARQALEQRSRRFLQGLVALLLLLVAGSLIVTAVIANQQQDLQREQDRTAQSLATAVAAEATSEADARAAQLALAQSLVSQAGQALAAQDSSRALLLALEANQIPDPPAHVEGVLAAGAFAPGARKIWHTSGLFPEQDVVIQALAILPDGALLLGDNDGRLRRWNPTTETTVWQAAVHTGPIHDLLMIDNGAHAVTAGSDGQVIVWDAQNGTPLNIWQHPGPVLALAKHPVQPWLAAGGEGQGGRTANGVIRLWDLNDGSQVAESVIAARDPVVALAFSPDGNRLLLSSGSRSYAAVDEFDLLGLTLPDLQVDGGWQTAAHDNIALHFAGANTFYTASSDQRVYRWAVGEAAPTAVWDSHRDQIVALDVTADGRFLLTGTDSGDLFVWDTGSGQPDARLLLHNAEITALAITPNGNRAYSADAAGGLILWDIRPFGRTLTLTGHEAPVLDVAFTPDGRHLLSSAGRMTGSSPLEEDNRLLLWDVQTGRLERVFAGHQDSIFQFVLSPDGETIVSTSFDQTIRIWDRATAAQKGVIFTGEVQLAAAIDSSGEMLATSHLGGGIVIWQLATETAVHTLTDQAPQIWALDISPDGRLLLSGGDDGVSLWEMASGERLQHWTAQGETVTAVQFSPDGTQAITAGNDNRLLLWDVATGEIVQQFAGHLGIRTRVAFSPDGRYLISSGWDGKIIVRDLATGAIKQQLQGHETTFIMDLALSPGGQMLATAGVDNQIILWQLMTNFDDLATWINQNRSVGFLACDGRNLFRLPSCKN